MITLPDLVFCEGELMLLEGLHHISLGSSDLNRSVRFYTEVLDFELAEQTDGHAIVSLDPVDLRLNYIEGYKNHTDHPGMFSLAFILDVDDFTQAIQEIENNKVQIIKGPLMIEGGESLLIADPDGNLIELFYKE